MSRLILFVLLLAGLAIALAAVMSALRSFSEVMATHTSAQRKDLMPKTFQNIAYVVLILLMFGIVTGLLGAA